MILGPTPARHRTLALLRRMALLASTAALSACTTVGPDFKAPAPPAPSAGYVSPTEHAPANVVVPAAGPEDRWWSTFGSPALSRTVEAAVAGSPTLEAAQAHLVAAQEEVAVAASGRYPQVNLGASVGREKQSAAAFGLKPDTVPLPPNFNLYQVGVTASYSLDLFGGTRRTIEARQAIADTRRYELDAAAAALAGNAATRAIEIASARAQLVALEQILAADRETLDLVRQQRAVGAVSDRDVVAADAQFAADKALRPPIEQQLSAAHHSLAALVGTSPAEWSPPDLELADLRVPAQLPVSLPSELVRVRPDIRAAEARLHTASAEVGVATAQLYPQITLSAGYTASSLNGSSLFSAGAAAWSLLGGLTQPLFDGGARRAGRRAAVAEFNASAADYRQTVLLAFAQVGDILTALDHDTALLDAQSRALDLASESLRLERINYASGEAGVLSLLDSQRQLQRAALGHAQVQGQLYLDMIQLIVASGGGALPASGQTPGAPCTAAPGGPCTSPQRGTLGPREAVG
jgi:NodT family efflux transporter outer membrane factor (OMF) lipoprotein